VTFEFDPHHAEVASRNLAHGGLTGQVDLRVGPALETLPRLAAEGAGPFDVIFIDADKPNNPAYLNWAMKLSRPGTAIIGDNVVRGGAVIDSDSTGCRRFEPVTAHQSSRQGASAGRPALDREDWPP
jgi:predicted O-methyltransferase YrrM